MKWFYGSLIILIILLLASGVWIEHILAVSAQNLVEELELLTANLAGFHWDAAARQAEHLSGEWEEIQHTWTLFLNHEEIDAIALSLARVKEYIANHDQPLAMGEVAALRLLVNHIPEKEALSLTNIF